MIELVTCEKNYYPRQKILCPHSESFLACSPIGRLALGFYSDEGRALYLHVQISSTVTTS